MLDAAEIDRIKSANPGAEELHEYFGTMSYEEFREFLDYILTSGPGIKLNMVTALARKLHEHGHFSQDLTGPDREALIAEADDIMDFAMSIVDEEAKPRLLAAWAASKDYCTRFGFSSGMAYEILAPHTVFSSG